MRDHYIYLIFFPPPLPRGEGKKVKKRHGEDIPDRERMDMNTVCLVEKKQGKKVFFFSFDPTHSAKHTWVSGRGA